MIVDRDALGPDPCPLYDRFGPDDRYEMIRQIGRGGEGVVFVAVDRTSGRTLALKVLYRSADLEPAHWAARWAEVQSPHVVEVVAAGMSRGRVFIAMELVEGPTVREWLRTDPPMSERAQAVRDVVAGHVAVHAARTIVEDAHVKNMILAPGRGVVLIDPPSGGRHRALQSAPEVLLGGFDFRNTRRSDQYACAFTCWSILFGCKPYEVEDWRERDAAMVAAGVPRDEREHAIGELIAAKVRTAEPAGDTADAPAAMVAALRRAMAYDPADRFANMAALAAAMDLP